MKGCLSVIVAGLLLLVIATVITGKKTFHDEWSAKSNSVAAEPSIAPKGYFKDDLGNRLYTFQIARTTTAAQIQADANNLAFTAGHPMSAYYYIEGSQMPIDGVTFAKDYLDAIRVTDTPGLARPAYVFIRDIDGKGSTFTDCLSNPRDPTCLPSGM